MYKYELSLIDIIKRLDCVVISSLNPELHFNFDT